MPSARPRNNESDPSVTINGGSWNREINAAFSAPAPQPAARLTTIAATTGRFQSRQAAPNNTAEKPITAPTDRSIPPVTRIGVIATARSPTSTLRRMTSKRFVDVRKFGATRPKQATSLASAATSIRLDTGDHRWRHVGGAARVSGAASTRGIDGDRAQDDRTLERALPLRADAEIRQRRPYRAEQRDAQHGSGHGPAASCDRSAADHHGRDDLHFQAESGVARNLVEPRRIQERGQPGQRATHREHRQLDECRVDAGEAGGLDIRPSGEDRAPHAGMTKRPRNCPDDRRNDRAHDERKCRLSEPEPL